MVVAPSLDAEGQVKGLVKKHGIDYPVLSDAEASAKAYQVRGFPMMYVIGRDGKIVWKGHFKDAKFIPAIEEALKAGAPEPAAKAEGAKAAAPSEVYVLNDGRRIKAVKVVEAGEEYSIKDDAGKFQTVKKSDVKEIVKE